MAYGYMRGRDNTDFALAAALHAVQVQTDKAMTWDDVESYRQWIDSALGLYEAAPNTERTASLEDRIEAELAAGVGEVLIVG